MRRIKPKGKGQSAAMQLDRLRLRPQDPEPPSNGQDPVPPVIQPFPETALDALRSINGNLELAEAALQRLSPAEQLWAIWPGDGGFEPMPAGESIFNLRQQRVTSPKGTLDINMPEDVADRVQSFVLMTDTQVWARVLPGFGSWVTGGAIIEASARGVEFVTLRSDVPYNVVLVFGDAPEAVRVNADRFWQFRNSDTTFTKVAAAGVADAFTAFDFVPVSRDFNQQPKVLSQADFGVDFLRLPGWGDRLFIIRNLGPGDADVDLFVSGSRTVALSAGWVQDPDVGGAVTIPAGDAAVLESSILGAVMQLRGRVNEAEAAATEARLIVEFSAVSSGER